ncbi:RdgB/HAM1 family non-canonical purine NTP pyrophosphatase [Rhodospirillum sp. A1_3_36]|uniref:RdgB/HAM1 family non-canonical purine NTP pyrophosphatase n=1 Tax=Rhodospirillum sp. A1_3_36 TaxID=3391666 RepID=UPI0039A60E56
MTRKLTQGPLVVASHNAGKVREINALIAPFGLEAKSAGELNLPEPEETGTTFQENALIKARAAAEASGLPALADDSGLTVSALDGAPGVYSARWAGPEKDFGKAMEKINTLLTGSPDRSAAFLCVLALAWPDGHVETFEGRVDGLLIWPARGEHGFGYDPIFQPEGHTATFGEMASDAKQAISHRARAFAKMVDACLKP